ncbi:MAG: succinate dehydrogenase/fumarate reductase iron-sulfur subunit, partial [Spirulinaceae cyanobacterium RM2_2_10]|nr:succinate dehydrogenase/fumarate reductase iron-sulfur subunit [Spirulinaceae cyanobacterium RM2_2_10]
MQVTFNIVRQRSTAPARVESYTIEAEAGQTILDCLNHIKWELDGSLAFRKNCRNTICGSCAMRINGRSALACKENVGSELARAQANAGDGTAVIAIAPLGNLPVVKDLIVEMQPFWDNLDAVEPYISTQGRQVPEREFLQTPAERAQLEQMGNCIMCGACYSECNAREVNPQFAGPHALAKAWRTVADARDQQTDTRLAQYNDTNAVWGCTRCYLCNEVCPMGVAPMEQISQIKRQLLARHDDQTSRPIRHRKRMVELVKSGGWVDERQFGVQVVGNYFRDLRGLLSHRCPWGYGLL